MRNNHPNYDGILSIKKEFEMKKAKFLSVMLIAGLCVFSACNKDEDKGEALSKLKPEEHKEKLATEGEAMVEKMGAVADLETYTVVEALLNLMDEADTESNLALKFGLGEINSLKAGTKEYVEVEKIQKVSDVFKEEAGIYTWDLSTKEWLKTKESETVITYKFKVDGTDAEVSVSSFKTIAASVDGDNVVKIDSELPLELKMHIILGDKTLTSFELKAQWNEDNTPKELVEIFVIEGFKYTTSLINTNNKISLETSFKHDDYTIYANGVEVDGKFDYKTMNTFSGEDDNGYSEALGQEVIDKGNVWFQLGNIKAVGIFDANDFIKELDPEKEPTKQVLVDLLNVHVKMYIKYANENEVMAKGEFFLEESDYYGEKEISVSCRMIFSDGSAVADDFFTTGFGKMTESISDLIKEVNKNYGFDLEE